MRLAACRQVRCSASAPLPLAPDAARYSSRKRDSSNSVLLSNDPAPAVGQWASFMCPALQWAARACGPLGVTCHAANHDGRSGVARSALPAGAAVWRPLCPFRPARASRSPERPASGPQPEAGPGRQWHRRAAAWSIVTSSHWHLPGHRLPFKGRSRAVWIVPSLKLLPSKRPPGHCRGARPGPPPPPVSWNGNVHRDTVSEWTANRLGSWRLAHGRAMAMARGRVAPSEECIVVRLRLATRMWGPWEKCCFASKKKVGQPVYTDDHEGAVWIFRDDFASRVACRFLLDAAYLTVKAREG
jgi:hypothetical protein